jgi:alginate O-acetyltransferase complex protein AlgJ
MSQTESHGRLSREEIAQRDIGRTTITPGLAWLVSLSFLATLVIPPTLQLIEDVRSSERQQTPSCAEIFKTLPTVAEAYRRQTGNVWERIFSANRRMVQNIGAYERQLEERSLLTTTFLPPTQHWLTRLAGLGNEKAYVGKQGWLFYRPDVDFVTGPGFLEPAVLRRRRNSSLAQSVQPDPRPAILEFRDQLAARGIKLILLPMPGKAAICPDQLARRAAASNEVLTNPSFKQFQEEMETANIPVLDPTPLLMQAQARKVNQFLRTDTHWTPEAMELVAIELKNLIERTCSLREPLGEPYPERLREVENLGDIAAMLHLPPDQKLFPPERVTIREITELDGSPWRPSESAEILLLGDSYTNIYSLPEMNWGANAGLAERLSAALARPVDRLAQNDGGSHAVRQTLHQQIAQGRDRLKGKSVVIWEFAVRELSGGDWKSFPMAAPGPNQDASRKPASPAVESVLVKGTVRAAAGAPQPGSVPYRDAVTGVHLEKVTSADPESVPDELLIYAWGLRENQIQEAARFTPGQQVTLRLIPWEQVRNKYERFNRIELDDPDFKLIELPLYWAEEQP